jgi:hypothetical protein
MSGGPQEGGEGSERRPGPRRPSTSSIAVGLVFIAIVVVAAVNAVRTEDSGVLGADSDGDLPLAEFAVPDARSDLEGDANIAQDDCEVSEIPCPEEERRTPACEIEVDGAIRVCDLLDRPLVLSFWFTRGGECESQQDAFESAYRRYQDQVRFLGINVRDERDEVERLIDERGWTHPIGLDPDGALSNLYRVGGCPTFVYAYPGGITEGTSVGELDAAELGERIEELIERSREREGRLR